MFLWRFFYKHLVEKLPPPVDEHKHCEQSEATLHLEAVIEDMEEELQHVIFEQRMPHLQDWEDLPCKTLENYPSSRLRTCLTDLLFLCNYHDNQDLRIEVRTIAGSLLEQIAKTSACGKIQRNLTFIDRSSLRIAFLGKLTDPVGNYFLPALVFGNELKVFNRKIEIFVYSTTRTIPADYNQGNQKSFFLIDCTNEGGQVLAQRIYNQGIDILVDLQGGAEGNRLDVFPFRPARLQLSWAGYPGSAGMSSITAKLTDCLCDVPPVPNDLYTERLLSMPNDYSFLCFQPLSSCSLVHIPTCKIKSKRPKDKRIKFMERITIAVMGVPNKCNHNVWKALAKSCDTMQDLHPNLFIRILHKSDGPAFILPQRKAIKAILRVSKRRRFEEMGRVNLKDYYNLHRKIDFIFDTFPYSGTTSVFVACALGVPLVTWYRGNTGPHAHNTAGSILLRLQSQLVEEACVARNQLEFTSKAVQMGTSPALRSQLRRELPRLFYQSKLTQTKTYRDAWMSTVHQEWLRLVAN